MQGTYIFTQAGRGASWVLHNSPIYHDRKVSICPEGLEEYLRIPSNVAKFTLTMADTRPVGDNYFEFTRENQVFKNKVGLKTEERISWTTSTRSWMQDLYARGYRFATVEYDS